MGFVFSSQVTRRTKTRAGCNAVYNQDTSGKKFVSSPSVQHRFFSSLCTIIHSPSFVVRCCACYNFIELFRHTIRLPILTMVSLGRCQSHLHLTATFSYEEDFHPLPRSCDVYRKRESFYGARGRFGHVNVISYQHHC